MSNHKKCTMYMYKYTPKILALSFSCFLFVIFIIVFVAVKLLYAKYLMIQIDKKRSRLKKSRACSRDLFIESTPPHKACVFPCMRLHKFYERSLEQAPDVGTFEKCIDATVEIQN